MKKEENMKTKPEPNPVLRTMLLEKKLIQRLNKEISEIGKETEERIGKIRFRIQMAQTLFNALQRSRK